MEKQQKKMINFRNKALKVFTGKNKKEEERTTNNYFELYGQPARIFGRSQIPKITLASA